MLLLLTVWQPIFVARRSSLLVRKRLRRLRHRAAINKGMEILGKGADSRLDVSLGNRVPNFFRIALPTTGQRSALRFHRPFSSHGQASTTAR